MLEELGPIGGLGPSANEFWACWTTQAPYAIGAVWLSCAIFVIATLSIGFKHEQQLRMAEPSLRRLYYLRISAMSRVFVLTATASLIGPRGWTLWAVIQKIYEAVVISTFGHLLFQLLAHEASVKASGTAVAPSEAFADPPADTPSPPHTLPPNRHAIVGLSSGAQSAEQMHPMLAFIASQGPRRHLTVPPFCCLAAPCVKPYYMDSNHLVFVLLALRQFVVLTPVLSVVIIWGTLTLNAPHYHLLNIFYIVLTKLTTILALWALFILFWATHELLTQWHTHIKFLAIKIFLIVILLQDSVLEKIMVVDIVRTSFPGHQCLAAHNLAHFWSEWLVALEAVGMAVLLRWGFPASDLGGHAGMKEVPGVLIEIGLLRHRSSSLATARLTDRAGIEVASV
ncbi:organic solute transporter subunit alpha/Transmembrane protein [Pavlovales sp. CCMP2436]|nr:organic solute transporter subunit alpha/Transmembrane protein [Pavlovales sp. CCMP2436]